mmetsp:Transcript_25365/g.31258  ORF Transcript_25365/g.31258 Transcript_25365/m.31258 type:complete len:469 (+) Transcript_25365:178-1584(+)
MSDVSTDEVSETISTTKKELIIRNKNDVVAGRGSGSNRHPGNTNFRRLIKDNKELYLSRCKNEKMLVARDIFYTIQAMDPVGRFLQKNPETGKWFEIGKERALEKISQALREKNPKGNAQVQVPVPSRGPDHHPQHESSVPNNISESMVLQLSDELRKARNALDNLAPPMHMLPPDTYEPPSMPLRPFQSMDPPLPVPKPSWYHDSASQMSPMSQGGAPMSHAHHFFNQQQQIAQQRSFMQQRQRQDFRDPYFIPQSGFYSRPPYIGDAIQMPQMNSYSPSITSPYNPRANSSSMNWVSPDQTLTVPKIHREQEVKQDGFIIMNESNVALEHVKKNLAKTTRNNQMSLEKQGKKKRSRSKVSSPSRKESRNDGKRANAALSVDTDDLRPVSTTLPKEDIRDTCNAQTSDRDSILKEAEKRKSKAISKQESTATRARRDDSEGIESNSDKESSKGGLEALSKAASLVRR